MTNDDEPRDEDNPELSDDDTLDTADTADTDDAADTAGTDTDADSPETDDEVTGLESTASARPRRDWRRYARIGLVAAVFAGAFGLAGGLGWKLWEQHTVTRAGDSAQQTAVGYAKVLTSIDSDHVDDNFAAVLNGATGDFKDMYTKSSVQLRQLLVDNKATAEGAVVDSAVQSESKDKVVVLLMVDQKVTNTALPDPRVDRTRMKMTMEKVDDHWLASKVELP